MALFSKAVGTEFTGAGDGSWEGAAAPYAG